MGNDQSVRASHFDNDGDAQDKDTRGTPEMTHEPGDSDENENHISISNKMVSPN